MADTGELRIDDLLTLVETGRELAEEVSLNSLLKGLSDADQDKELVQFCKEIREAIQP
jgi:hypothetical protein